MEIDVLNAIPAEIVHEEPPSWCFCCDTDDQPTSQRSPGSAPGPAGQGKSWKRCPAMKIIEKVDFFFPLQPEGIRPKE